MSAWSTIHSLLHRCGYEYGQEMRIQSAKQETGIIMDKSTRRAKLVIGAFAALILMLRWLFPERLLDYTGPRALLDSGFALGLLFLILLMALGLGLKAQRRLGFEDLSVLEQTLLRLAIGLGILAYAILVLGLTGLLQPWAVLLLLIVMGVWSHEEWSQFASNIPAWLKMGYQGFRGAGLEKRFLLIVLGLIFFLTLSQALSPPTDPDGLIHHLQAPKLFLEAGRLYAAPDFVFADYPSTIESLFSIGMAFGSDTFAKLIHLTYATLLVLATYMLGRRHMAPGSGWVAIAILVGMPIFPVWSSLAYIDMAWALYEFLAVYAIVVWGVQNHRRWLILAGLMTGLALGSKYLAFEGAAAMGLWILWHTRKEGWKTILGSAAIYGATALLVSSPWYLKNLLWFGNPIYPYLSSEAASLVGNYKTFGLLDYLLLPLNLYLKRELFVGVYGSIEFPSIFFLLVFLYPWSRRSKAMDGLAGLTLLRYIFWALISHWRFRYLLPALPGLSLLSSHVMINLTTRPTLRRWGRILAIGLLGGMLMVTLAYSVIHFLDVQPLRVVSGAESKADFLRRQVSDYAAKEFIQTNLSPEARVLMPWDARGYYCDNRCLPDWLRSKWVELASPNASPSVVADKLSEMNVSHLLLSIEDVDYSVINDESGKNEQALEFLLNEFRPACLKEIYRDEWTRLYEVKCK
jgi:hypothetical protein